MPHAVPLRHRRPNRRLLVRKPRVSYFSIPGVGRDRLGFDAVLGRLRALPPGEHNILATFPAPGGGWDCSLGCQATVTADGSVELEVWAPGPIIGEGS